MREAASWAESDTERALTVWAQYQKSHDVSARAGQAVGIDPASGRVWFGDSAKDIVAQIDSAGQTAPLFFLRVGQDFYATKGGRR